LTNVYGCDSIIELTLTVRPQEDTTFFIDTICFGENYTANGFNENESDVYCRTLTNVYGCDSTVQLTLTVNPKPVVNLNGNRMVDINDSIVLTLEQGLHYRWSTGDTVYEISVKRTLFDSDTGIVWVLATTADNCTDSDTIEIIFIDGTGVEEYPVERDYVRIYPNPSDGELYIEFKFSGKNDIRIVDVTGKTIHEGVYLEQKIKLQLDIHTGVYFVQVNNRTVRKIVIN
jgi:hypothetical protein